MSKEKVTNWKDAFIELGNSMATFYESNKSNFAKKLYDKVYLNLKKNEPSFAKNEHRNIHNYFDILNRTHSITAQSFYLLDPIHVFALINQNNISQENRVNNINFFLTVFQSTIKYEDIDFIGCPRPLSLRILSKRGVEVMLEIWKFFILIKEGKQSALSQDNFSVFKNWYGVEISAFTIFLFWIEPYNFIPIDKNTLNLLINFNVINKKPSTYLEYKKTIPFETSDNYSFIAEKAWQYESLDEKEKELVSLVIQETYQKSEFIEKANFRIIAIRPLEGCDENFTKVLTQEKLYILDNAFNFISYDEIIFNEYDNIDLYNIQQENNSLKINIQAIVGKNGTGKSSVIELLYWAINNLAKYILKKETSLKHIYNLCVEIYFQIDTIYKITLKQNFITVFNYSQNGNAFIQNSKSIKPNKEFLAKLFYTTVNNYSHFALNELELGKWVYNLFHKNDGYQSPIVISPLRTDGNFDINRETALLYNRYLFTLLSPETGLGYIGKNKFIEKIELQVNFEKWEKVKKFIAKKGIKENGKDAIDKLISKIFHIKFDKRTETNIVCRDYLIYKLITITETYKKYKLYKGWYNNTEDHTDGFLQKVKDDPSHITNKIRQAVYYLKYGHLKYNELVKQFDVDNLKQKIQDIIGGNIYNEKLGVIDLLPPSFLSCDYILNNGSRFSMLSSGEKQLIYTVNSIIYHLININSVEKNEEDIKYEFVNVIFDEVELYFHPDMQRTFIDTLLNALKKIILSDIRGVNLIFVTHSPFILSDIPLSNILFLGDEISEEMTNTFGANIHDLLKHNFFLKDGYMGEFAKKKILELVEFLNSNLDNNENWDEEKARKFILIVGEPIIKERLNYLFENKFIVKDKITIERQIIKLQEKLNQIKINEATKN